MGFSNNIMQQVLTLCDGIIMANGAVTSFCNDNAFIHNAGDAGRGNT